MIRRQALKVITLGALARASERALPWGKAGAGLAWTPGGYRLQFFTPEEGQLLDELMDLVIPADGHSPGARAAQVSLFADLMISTGTPEEQQHWRRGLEAMRAEAGRSSPGEALALAARGEAKPHSDLERFFVRLKQMTVDGYYTSNIGLHQDLQYAGNDFLSEFPGCSHEEHR